MAKYAAWQLPNSYTGPHPHQSTTSRGRLNKQLLDLRTKKSAGNGQSSVQGQTQHGGGGRRRKRYHPDGKSMHRVLKKKGGIPVYLRGPKKSYPQARLWYCRFLPHPLEEESSLTL